MNFILNVNAEEKNGAKAKWDGGVAKLRPGCWAMRETKTK